jgi:alpha-tubulin suppressor-like RCC1 family protein
MPLHPRTSSGLLGLATALGVAGCGDQADTPTGFTETAMLAAASVAPAFRQLSAGSDHTCGVTLEGRAYCWGHNGDGQLGDRTTTDASRPVPVAGGLTFRLVSAAGNHTCG